jgi:hypothetical protein
MGIDIGPDPARSLSHAEEIALAWALADVVAAFVERGAHAWLCAKIGAGEHAGAISDSLKCFVGRKAPLPARLAAPVRAWILGYRGSERERMLRDLIRQIRVETASENRGVVWPETTRTSRATEL